MTANCTNAPDAVPSDAGVAGVGVLLSFIITAGISLVLSASLIFQEARSRNSSSESVLRRKLLNSYSDQQILTGIGLQSIGLGKVSSMVPYHFFLVWMLSLLSMAVHNATLLALARDFRRDWVLRWMRQLLMLANLVLSCVYGVYVLRAVERGINDSTFPVSCVWDAATPDYPPSGNYALSFAGTIVVIAGNVLIFALSTWYLHARTQRFYVVLQVVGLLLMTAFAIGATVRVAYLADAFASGTPIKLSDDGERQWSFGQLLSVGMLVLPLVSVVEILRGEIKCAPPVAMVYDDDKGVLLGEGGSGSGSEGEQQELRARSNPGVRRAADFQPNPLWGSQTNLFKK
ncbi:uncharacterized protein F4807DRAFT_55947 [Annulohypoxylon truncatum]|uniref:uncharacterized protein n=1 Tax=Annulohypoxylon truncatum TaxID=327061 RepID=UPI0020079D91|nr:uncharacterized protein F4807DRAFT_55947 [Annulohypoxylon truncatum]KAI1210697.1 hypothetical protein F4807DRAFT_55947 [Annulohypoxylon truncatum]